MDKNKKNQEKEYKKMVEMIEKAKKEANIFMKKNTTSGAYSR